jgi:hypothetical protein
MVSPFAITLARIQGHAMERKAQAQADKQEARKERNEAQAIEERAIWGKIEEANSKALEIASRKPVIPYSEELAIRICEELSNGVSLQKICARPDMPAQGTIYRMIAQEAFFREIYARAREQAAHTLFDQMIDIADDSSRDLLEDGSANNAAIARARLQIDTRARVAGKLAPRVYGERIEALAGTVTINNNTLQIDSRTLDADQRNNLRAMLLQARDSKLIEQ